MKSPLPWALCTSDIKEPKCPGSGDNDLVGGIGADSGTDGGAADNGVSGADGCADVSAGDVDLVGGISADSGTDGGAADNCVSGADGVIGADGCADVSAGDVSASPDGVCIASLKPRCVQQQLPN